MRYTLLILRAGLAVGAVAAVLALVVDGAPGPVSAAPPTPVTDREPAQRKATTAKAKAPTSETPPGVVTFAAVGDIVMGSTPDLPRDGGRSFFDAVETDLAADVVLGNLEGTLSRGGSSKCRAGSTSCFAFQTPPFYARHLRDAGFNVLNLANNHAFDYGPEGLRQTVAALDRVGVAHTGTRGTIAVHTVGAIRVAIVGFASYPWANSLTDMAVVRREVRRADRIADVVVATAHMGAEGVAHQHVARRTETYLGEARGHPMRFARAAIDAGADLVVGHGPHVLRGMEWYRGRLIAYSLGNFAGYGVFSLGGPLSVSGILRVTLTGDGRYETGLLVATRLVGRGTPALDPAEQAHAVVRTLSRVDFGRRGVKVSRSGALS
jgi:poly-gamma-glutamate capsule biosynthesis protein CapA/YwtB (metallophosphatase superfamily)